MPILWMTGYVIHEMVRELYLEMGKRDPTADQLTMTIRGVTVIVSADAIAELLQIPKAAVPPEGDAPPRPAPRGDARPPPALEDNAPPPLVPEAHAVAGDVELTIDHILLSMINRPGPFHKGGVVI